MSLLYASREVYDDVTNTFEFATGLDVKEGMSFADRMAYLSGYGCPENDPHQMVVLIGFDHVEHSFGLTWFRRSFIGEEGLNYRDDHQFLARFPQLAGYKQFMNGGLIYHGDEWGIHT